MPDTTVLLGGNVIIVGILLLMFACSIRGKTDMKEVATFAFLTGVFNFGSGIYAFFIGDVAGLVGYTLFAFTYFLVAFNTFLNSETQTGLGIYSLFVAISAVFFIIMLVNAGLYIGALNWFIWGQIWFTFFVANFLQKDIENFVVANLYFVTAYNWVVGFSLLMGWATLSGFKI